MSYLIFVVLVVQVIISVIFFIPAIFSGFYCCLAVSLKS